MQEERATGFLKRNAAMTSDEGNISCVWKELSYDPWFMQVCLTDLSDHTWTKGSAKLKLPNTLGHSLPGVWHLQQERLLFASFRNS